MGKRTTRNLNQKAVHWPRSGYNSYGEDKHGDPAEIDCHWDYRQVEVLDANGNNQATDAVVTVGSDVAVGDLLWLGRLRDVSGTETLLEVVGFDKNVNIKGRQYGRTVYLKRLASEVPSTS